MRVTESLEFPECMNATRALQIAQDHWNKALLPLVGGLGQTKYLMKD